MSGDRLRDEDEVALAGMSPDKRAEWRADILSRREALAADERGGWEGLDALRSLSEDASPDWTMVGQGPIAWMVREGPRGAQIGNFICVEDAELAVAAVAYVRDRLAAAQHASHAAPRTMLDTLAEGVEQARRDHPDRFPDWPASHAAEGEP